MSQSKQMDSQYPDNPLSAIQHDDFDSVDGFRGFLKKAFDKFSCATGNKGQAEQDEPSKAPLDFTENKSEQKPLPESFEWDENNTYDFTHPKRGLAIIINNEDFSKSKEFGDRPGSSYDASALYHSFRFLGFDVMPYDNLSGWKMVEVLKNAATQYNHKEADCFVCAILTHGDQILTQNEWERMNTEVRMDLLFGTDGRAIATKAAVELFNDKNCPLLTDKPRLFFLQACRGDKYDHGQNITVLTEKTSTHMRKPNKLIKPDGIDSSSKQNVSRDIQRQESLSSSVDPPEYHLRDTLDAASAEDDQTEDTNSDEGNEESQEEITTSDKTDAFGRPRDNIPVSPAPLFKDFLIMYATPPGHFAWRRRTGAWFIQSLCKVFDHGMLSHISLQRALTYVSGITARDYQSENPNNPEMHGKKEVPVVESKLTKDLLIPGRSKFTKNH